MSMNGIDQEKSAEYVEVCPT